MANEVPDSIKNFPKCLEEALEFTVEDTSPPFENIISGLGSFDLSHSPPPSTTVEEDSVNSAGNTSDKVSISAPPSTFLCYDSEIKSNSTDSMPSLISNFDTFGSSENLASGLSTSPISELFKQNLTTSSSQTSEFPYFQSFQWFKEKYPELLSPTSFSPPIQSGRVFSLSQLDQIDDLILENYGSIDPCCTPIPAGFLEEMGRMDSVLSQHVRQLEDLLPNEDWVYRRICEGPPIKSIILRYFFFCFDISYFLTSINFLVQFLFSNIFFFFRLYDVYAFKKERASPFTSRKGKLVDYLLCVTRDDGDKNYL